MTVPLEGWWRWLLNRLAREVGKTGRFWTVFAANTTARWHAAKSDRLPAQPWRIKSSRSDIVIKTLPWHRAANEAVAPVFYKDTGAVRGSPGPESYDFEISHTTDVLLLPRAITLRLDGTVLRRDFLSRAAKHHALKRVPIVRMQVARDVVGGRILGRIAENVFLADSWWPTVYGHQLLEVVPRLALLQYLPAQVMVATSAPLSQTLLTMFEVFGVGRDRVIPVNGPVLCRSLYLSDSPVVLTSKVHPVAREAFAVLRTLAARSSIDRHDRVYVSRAGVRDRRLVNEGEIEALFASYGFAIVRPETLPIEDQVGLFGGARMLAGLGGSAMHNAVFCPRDTPVLIVQSPEMSTGTDAALAEPPRRLGFVLGNVERSEDHMAWRVDAALVDSAIRQHFGL